MGKSKQKQKIQVDLWTDGSSRREKRVSTSAFIIVENNYEVYRESSMTEDDDNNRAELHAVIQGLKKIYEHYHGKKIRLTVYSDSQIIVDCINGENNIRSYVPNYKKASRMLWLELFEMIDKVNTDITFEHIKARSGIYYNEEVDWMCSIKYGELLSGR